MEEVGPVCRKDKLSIKDRYCLRINVPLAIVFRKKEGIECGVKDRMISLNGGIKEENTVLVTEERFI